MDKKKVFFMMPINPEFESIFRQLQKKCEENNCFAERACDLSNQRSILHDIIFSIENADFVVGDLTALNPNVFYELGIAHCLEKKVVVITQSLDELPFDLKAYRVIPYGTRFDEFDSFLDKFSNILKQALDGSLSFSNPFTDYKHKKKIPHDSSNQENSNSLGDLSIGVPSLIDEELSLENMGSIDYFLLYDQSMSSVTSSIENITQETKSLSEKIGLKTSEVLNINESVKKGVKGSTLILKNISRDISTILINYGKSLSNESKNYEKSWNNIDLYFENYFNNLITNNKEDINNETKNNYVKSMYQLLEETTNAKISFTGMKESIVNLRKQKIESSISQSCNYVERELQILIDLLDRTISTVDKTIKNVKGGV